MKKRGKGERERERKNKRKIAAIIITIVIVAIIVIIISVFTSQRTGFSFGANTALIKIENVILTSKSGFMPYTATFSDEIVNNIEDAIMNPNIKAIIFEINSPGGSAVASYEIADAIKRARQANKTTVALIREQGTSGAYWIASSCEHIISHPLALTGSIGVLASYLEFSGLLEDYNVTYERLVKGEHKDVLSPYRELDDEERMIIDQKLDIIYQTFIQEVAVNRNLTQQQVQGLADGMFYIGKEAKALGLIDELGSEEDAVNYIESKLDITVKIKEYKKQPSFIEKLMRYQILNSFWMGRGIGASFVDQNLLTSLNPIIPRT